MPNLPELRVLLPSHHWFDQNAGAPGADYRLAAALTALGNPAQPYFFDDAFKGQRSWGRWAQLFFPWAVARECVARWRKGEVDVIESTAGDLWVARHILRRQRGNRPLLAVRSHGVEHVHVRAEREAAAREGRRLGWRYGTYHASFRLWEVAQDLRQADLVVVHSAVDRDFVVGELDVARERVHIVPCGISDRFFRNRATLDVARLRRVLFVGSWINNKGVDLLPEIARGVLGRHSDVEFTLAGVGLPAEDVLASFAPEHRQRIRVVPRIPNDALPTVMSSHGIFLFPSRCEGFGLVVIEAMARGLVIVAAPVGVVPEVVRHGKSGFLVEQRSAEAFATMISAVIDGGSRAIAIGEEAQEAASPFTWERAAQTRVELYRGALGRSGPTFAH
jgi:glycosyltransferase involved in cell wall biosynthesis